MNRGMKNHAVAWFLALSLYQPVESAAQAVTDSYKYDALGRLTEVEAGQGVKTTYAFDQAGNRSSVSVKLNFQTMWEAESLPHAGGFAEYSGWGASPGTGATHITYGPYATDIPVGSRVAAWKIMIKDDGDPNEDLGYLDVWDSTTGTILAVVAVKRRLFQTTMAYRVIELPFTLDASRAGHSIEFRTFYMGIGGITVDKIGFY